MSNQPTSFRFPFKFPADIHPQVDQAIRYAYSGLKDVNDAIGKLTSKVNANAGAVSTVTQVVNTVTGGGGGTPASPLFGFVNLQPNLMPGAYILAQTDLGGLILVQSSIAFALTLNSGLTLPFFATVFNLGSATITATPNAGNVNNAGSIAVVPNQLAIFYFDGSNWWDVFPLLAQTFAAVPSNWIRSYDAATGLFTASQPAASDLSNGITGSGGVVLANAPTLASTVSITGLQVFADNATAIAGGLVAGNLYRNGADPDLIAVVH